MDIEYEATFLNTDKSEFLKDSVSAIIVRKKDNKVFIGRRKEDKEFSPGLWETIGGRIERVQGTHFFGH